MRNRRGSYELPDGGFAILMLFAAIGFVSIMMGITSKPDTAPAQIAIMPSTSQNTTPTQPVIIEPDPELSVSPLPTTTSSDGYKGALVSNCEKMNKFVIAYSRCIHQNFGWGTGLDDNTVIYDMYDETSIPLKSEMRFVIKMIEHRDDFSIEIPKTFGKFNYSPKSAFQSIILKNSEEDGKEIFKKIFDALEKIENPKKVDE